MPHQNRQHADDQHSRGQGEVPRQVANALHSAHRGCVGGRHSASREPARLDRQHQERNGQQQVGNDQQDGEEQLRYPFHHAAAARRAPGADRHGQQPRQKSGRAGEEKGGADALAQKGRDRAAICQRVSEIAARGGRDPLAVADKKGPVQPCGTFERDHGFGRDAGIHPQVGVIVSWGKLREGKRRERNGNQQEQAMHGAPQGVISCQGAS